MTKELIQNAKNGDLKALKQLINQAFAKQGISVREIELTNDGVLKIKLRALQGKVHSDVLQAVQDNTAKLKIQGVFSVEVFQQQPFEATSPKVSKNRMNEISSSSSLTTLGVSVQFHPPSGAIGGTIGLLLGIAVGWALTPKLPASPIAEYVPVTLPPQTGAIKPRSAPPDWDEILDKRSKIWTSDPEDCPKYAARYEDILEDIYIDPEDEDGYYCIFKDDN